MSNVDMQTIKDLGLTVRSQRLDPNVPVIDFADYLIEQGIFSSREELSKYIRETSIPYSQEDNGKYANGTVIKGGNAKQKIPNSENNIAIADFSQLYDFYPTGDPDQDYQIRMGLNYNKTCYNGKNYWDYDKLTAAEDFTGMSNAEKYKAIYEKYQHCYGENFLDINAVPYVVPPHSEDFYGELLDNFYNELEAAVGDYSERAKACREALYGDMSDYDIRAAIVEKYSSDGTLTNSDLYKIAKAMDQCGVGGGIHNILRNVLTKDRSQVLYNSTLGIKTSVETSCAMREEMLASPLDPYMLDGIERRGNAMGAMSTKLYSALDQLREMCGAYSGGISADSVPQSNNAKDGFVWIKI